MQGTGITAYRVLSLGTTKNWQQIKLTAVTFIYYDTIDLLAEIFLFY